MSVIHHQWSEGFKILPDAIPRDPRLSLRDIGLLWVLLEKPDNWKFSVRGLEKILPNDGLDTIRSAAKSLEKNGYLRRHQPRGSSNGKFECASWEVSDMPFPETGTPWSGKPYTEKPCTENPTQYKNKKNKRNQTQRQKKPLCQETEDEISGIHFFNGEAL